ncbi:TonB-dependent receptor [Catenovulum maritimum]|uniref:TonB-dependent receptor n=1 Tax=Catenovulum maritimum TaxID=1513271 RepID=A0A0J8GMS4_9ALTE|nr:TonB-dependent receptor [Catenovulum maritimum]KMT64087.1 hypothetical protein XM47_15990 [Catenovulum maritimum]
MNKKSTTSTFKLNQIAIAVGLLSIPNAVLAQQAQDEETEVIAVTGVRSSLEAALLTKREAISVVDAISASDIDALPALDLGEALQAIPGIQLQTDDGQRNSEITLRGLSGGFVKTTAEGMSFANPSRSEAEEGGSNPFGSFEASVFDGVTVVKSPTADMQEGGIAGTIDKKLQRALGKKSGKYSVSLGGRYEELTDDWNKEFKIQGSHHFIQDKFAIAFKVAGSEQNFRKDTANYTQYSTLVESQYQKDTNGEFILDANGKRKETSANYNIIDSDLAAYKTKHGLDPNAVVKAVTRAGQVSEVSSGDRISATVNLEFKPTDNLKLGTNLLYTKRTLDESNFEDVQFSVPNNPNAKNALIEPIGAPIQLANNEAGNPVYAVSHVKLTNANWAPANRLMSYTEEAKGIFLYADYATDDWVFNTAASYSKSLNEFQNQGLDIRHTNKGSGKYTLKEGSTTIDSINWAPSGIDVEINTGNGDLSKAYTKASGFDSVDYDATYTYMNSEGKEVTAGWSEVPLTSFSSTLNPLATGGKQVQFFVNGRVDRPERTEKSFQFDAKRFIDLGFDSAKFTSVKFGVRHSNEELNNTDLRVGAGGINVNALTSENLFKEQLFSDVQNPYFNGEFSGYYNGEGGWKSIDSNNLKALLQTNMRELEGAVEADPTGFYIKGSSTTPNDFLTRNFAADQQINAAYIMAEFEGSLANIDYRGNTGIRHVQTKNDITGVSNINGEWITNVTENDYSHSLPSANISFDITDDVIVRAAYAEALVRPNLRSQLPTGTISSNASKVKVTLPKSGLEPYTSSNYDLSIEWYNREGSAISFGVFSKEIAGLFRDQVACPVGFENIFGGEIGAVELSKNTAGELTCMELSPYVDENGVEGVRREVEVKYTINSEDTTDVLGYELSIQQKLDFLPYPWSGFGGVFNYTYVDTETLVDGKKQPMEKVSPRSYNLIGYWENEKLSMRLAYNWQDTKLISSGGSVGFLGSESREQSAGGRLDFSGSYKLMKNLKVNLLAYNLNDRQEYEFTGGNEDALYRMRYSGRTYQVNVNYAF